MKNGCGQFNKTVSHTTRCLSVAKAENSFLLFWKVVLLLMVIVSCNAHQATEPTLFTQLDQKETGVEFENKITSTPEFNIYKYRNFYNGGGVALGDINNDGLIDIYMGANQSSNKLFLNKGNLKFEDITKKAGVEGKKSWSTGVSMIDINGDGWLDIYVCHSGDIHGENKQNECFINNYDGTFTERAEEMGLADAGYSTQVAFFDFDQDGDLDAYILNNSHRSIGSFDLQQNKRQIRDSLGGNKLLRNDNGHFKDVSQVAGIYGSEIGFGLGIAIADLDKDGWMDIYVSNDFFERDYIYINNRDGTFREELEKQMPSISGASMGVDIADLNEDGYPEVFTTEMLPQQEKRLKSTMTFENWDKYQMNVKNGYYHQFTRNMLQRNNGVTSPGGITFSEVGRYSGVEASDWSWSALLADLNNDSYRDIYITNGIAQDILNQDYLAYIANDEVQRSIIKEKGVDYKILIDIIPSTPIPNYAYAGKGNFSFDNVTTKWGLGTPSFSNGAAYGDLDNDGDLDLVVNNVNMPAFIYRNNINDSINRYLKIKLIGSKQNSEAIGAKVTAKAGGRTFYLEQNPVRGFQSSVDDRLNFGLGNIKIIDSLIIEWPYGEETALVNIPTNQTLNFREVDAPVIKHERSLPIYKPKLFSELTIAGSQFAHKEDEYVDFDKYPLLNFMYSTQGPKLSVGDVNGDGLDDFFMGGAKGQPGVFGIQNQKGGFKELQSKALEADKESEDIGSAFFDADGDGDLDLYVTSGGNEVGINSFTYINRLYINNGKGNFSRSAQILPTINPESTSSVKACDFDQDGDIDLFVGVRLRPDSIGAPQNGYLLVNDGKGKFHNQTALLAPALLNVGMISDAAWADYDGDGDKDLVVVGEWMNIKLFNNKSGHFTEVSNLAGLGDTHGWWNTIEAADLNGDNKIDFICGNHGLNSRFRATKEKPIVCYVGDFNQNGSIEQVTCTVNGDSMYPFALRHDLVMQLPFLKKKYLRYDAYAGQTIQDIFKPDILEKTVRDTATILETVVLMNQGDGKFEVKRLPPEAQLTPIYAICVDDFNQDGLSDIILGGNLYGVKPEVGRYDASYGVFLKGLGNGNFASIPCSETGLFIQGEIRDIKTIKVQGKKLLMVARNNNTPEFFSIGRDN